MFVLGLGTVWLHAPPGGNMKCRQWVVTSAIYPNILPYHCPSVDALDHHACSLFCTVMSQAPAELVDPCGDSSSHVGPGLLRVASSEWSSLCHHHRYLNTAH